MLNPFLSIGDQCSVLSVAKDKAMQPHGPRSAMGQGPPDVQNTDICCQFFWTEFLSSDRRQYSERSGSDFDNNYSEVSGLASCVRAPQLVICATDLCSHKYSVKPS
jgi:hypothetical protein